MKDVSREQQLIDITFQIALTIQENHALNALPRERLAEWVATQLHICGFDTQPMGASWGVLK